MNFINCNNQISPDIMRKTIAFWSENSYQHIASLLKSPQGTTAVLQPEFKEHLENYYKIFKDINNIYKTPNKNLSVKPEQFFKLNEKFINLLERIKFEGFSGYPILQQSVFHYIYEQRYINAIFGMKNSVGFVLITEFFIPFSSHQFSCIYNQMYFWSIIGAMHPSLLLETNAFYNAINGYSKEFLTDITNNFNKINYRLSSLRKPIKKPLLKEIFDDFQSLNLSILDFLLLVKSNNHKIYSYPASVNLSAQFYNKVEHMIKEHTLVKEINENICKTL